ncbi:MAG: hypothetical protein ACHQZQ_06480 [SAR324 cluster bacterium]
MPLTRTRFASARSAGSMGTRGGAPAAFWWAVLALSGPWLRVLTPWGPVYPGQWLCVPLAAWALWRGALVQPERRWERPPLAPLAAFATFVALLALLRGQGSAALATVLASAALAVWAYAAYRLGLQGASIATFVPAAVFFLGTSLIAGGLAWLAQADWPAACILGSCDPAAPIPFAFQGGWLSPAQYLLALIFLLPPVGGAFLESWREGASGAQHWVLTAIVAGAGLGLLAGMRWWGFVVLALGLILLVQVLLPDRHPADRLLVRGLIFFTAFAPIALYGLVPGYGTALLFQPGSARALGIKHTLPDPAELSSDHAVRVPVRLVNAGTVALGASRDRPLRLKAMVLFTPRSGGESRMAEAGAARLFRDLAPGDAAEVTVAVEVPPWIQQGYVSWLAEDGAGRPILLTDALDQGFRFVNGDFTSLDHGGDNTLAALAARARAAPGMAIPSAGTRRGGVESALSDAFDTLFFSPLWGQAGGAQPAGQVFDPARPFFLQVLHRYGLIGVGLLVWFWSDLFRRATRLGFGRRGGAPLRWRLVPVTALLVPVVGLLSGEPSRFHSWWGCVLLGGFVQGVHERVFPPRAGGRLAGPLRVSWRAARAIVRIVRGALGMEYGLAPGSAGAAGRGERALPARSARRLAP